MGVKISAAEAANEVRRMRRNAGLPDIDAGPSIVPSSETGGAGSTGLTAAQIAAKEEADRLAKAQAEAARKQQEILDKRKAALKSFRDAVQSLFSQIKDSILSAFNLPELGNSVSSITRNIQKLLTKTRSFAGNITQLSNLGLNSDLLQQVIAAGPVAGSRLAAALVGGGAGLISQLNASFGEFGSLAGTIAGVGTSAAFANAQTVNNYSVNVTGGVATAADVGRAVVNAIRSFERQSGAAWRA
jgi:vacuolar-type H+-ATPase subunit E/Vma4